MENEFVPYQQALALKELGFDEECIGYYENNKNKIIFYGGTRTNTNFSRVFNSTHFRLVTPLYQQVFRWFREKHNLHTIINITISDKWYFEIYNLSDKRNCEIKIEEIFLLTYEEAELECLKRLIEIVKTK